MVTQQAVEVVTTKKPDRWKRVLEETGFYDYYHLLEFHLLAEIRGYGEAVMPVFREKGYTMAYPLMIRVTDTPPVISADRGYKDAACAPGLIGPVVSAPWVPEDVRLGLMRQFQDYLRENKIITVYSRLNPFFNQREFLRGFGEIRDEALDVSIDLTKPPEKQFSDYQRSHRKQIQKLQKLGFTVTEVGLECLDKFLELYYGALDRGQASQVYYFDKSYFEFLLNEMSDIMHLFACKDGDNIACISLVCACNGIIHALYAGTAPEYRPLSPNKLRIDAVREWGNVIGAHTFHLGGCLGGREDHLYQFKIAFGGQEHICSTWRYVADQEVYDDLCREVCRHSDTELDDSFFPKYRNPNLQLNTTASR